MPTKGIQGFGPNHKGRPHGTANKAIGTAKAAAMVGLPERTFRMIVARGEGPPCIYVTKKTGEKRPYFDADSIMAWKSLQYEASQLTEKPNDKAQQDALRAKAAKKIWPRDKPEHVLRRLNTRMRLLRHALIEVQEREPRMMYLASLQFGFGILLPGRLEAAAEAGLVRLMEIAIRWERERKGNWWVESTGDAIQGQIGERQGAPWMSWSAAQALPAGPAAMGTVVSNVREHESRLAARLGRVVATQWQHNLFDPYDHGGPGPLRSKEVPPNYRKERVKLYERVRPRWEEEGEGQP